MDITNAVALGIAIVAGVYVLYCLFWPQNL